MNNVMRYLLRADGTRVDLVGPIGFLDARKMIGAETCDVVSLRHLGHPLHVMLLDDLGHVRGLPVNVEATKLYHANCRPGTTHQIVGDVLVVPDGDYE